ncbi:GntR family transcriptional regulator [Parenemella sanctibonifatiensis]|uniref:GntR family transcriptional regulator n=1 Tax=Parenemella sanctibonifatiensis TaxID=2016505 RepID=A0A255EGS0_9ACTN|nr:GntR family transcriptional regulator [Parenemella sanctibonifatiensis]OYN88622.1 GntR family transcriptional regulator [Parenemella sanctibonifatiensis]
MLVVDPRSSVPPFEQLRSQLMAQIDSGELPPASKLPPVRRLAADLGIAPNTVARAYRELEAAGYVRAAGRNGTSVVGPQRQPHAGAEAEAFSATRAYVARMRELGLGREAMVSQLRRVLAEVEGS